MRKTISEPGLPDATDIGSIELDATSRDDIPAIYRNREMREELFRLLDANILPGHRRDTGRPGMGVLKQGLRCDHDRLRELADEHEDVKAFHRRDAAFDSCSYGLRTIRDNVELLTPELLQKADELAVATGCKVAGKSPGSVGRALRLVRSGDRCPPSDRLRPSPGRGPLPDPRVVAGLAAFSVSGWRQREHWERKAEEHCSRVNTARRWSARPKEVHAYPGAPFELAVTEEDSFKPLKDKNCARHRLNDIRRLIGHARRLAGWIEQSVLRGETIPRGAKARSIFEEHTRWISKGKAGTPVELGIPVRAVDDGDSFVLGCRIVWKGGDIDTAVPVVESCRKGVPRPAGVQLRSRLRSPHGRKSEKC